jgi:hypothetical protein
MGSVTATRRLRLGRIARSVLAIASGPALALVLGTACGGPAARTADVAVSGEWRTFEGTWTASGTRTALDLGSGHRAWTVYMNGSLSLTGENRPGVGFQAEMIGFTDSVSGLVGRSVWTDERGDKVFSELTGDWVGSGGARIVGTFLGGTGRYAGVSGGYEFQWQYMIPDEGGSAVSGRTKGLKVRARLGGPPAGPSPAGSAQ